MPSSEVTRKEVPHGHWFREGCRMVRVVENTIGGHIIESRAAPKRQRQRDDERRIDNSASDAID